MPQLPAWVRLDSNLSYGQYKENLVDIFQPAALGKRPRPAVIMIHGGGWVGGTKEGMTQHCLRYVEQGFVVANVEYRLAKVATAPAAINDVLQATRWFFQNADRYGVDKKRIVVIGGSAGGHLALMTGMTPKSAGLGPPAKVAAVVSYASIAELAEQLDGPYKREYTATWIPEQPGRLELANRISPANYVRRGLPPILLIHGETDQTYGQARRLTDALRSKGVESRLITVPGGQHAFTSEQWEQVFPQIFDWLRKRAILDDEEPSHPPRKASLSGTMPKSR
jgi:acetyl esterase/lipase